MEAASGVARKSSISPQILKQKTRDFNVIGKEGPATSKSMSFAPKQLANVLQKEFVAKYLGGEQFK